MAQKVLLQGGTFFCNLKLLATAHFIPFHRNTSFLYLRFHPFSFSFHYFSIFFSFHSAGWFRNTEPLELGYLLGVAVGCLAALLILMCWCIYAIRAKKCCFKSKLEDEAKNSLNQINFPCYFPFRRCRS
jgi:hypothetical protein